MQTANDIVFDGGVFHKGEHKKCFAYEAHTVCEKRRYVIEVEATSTTAWLSMRYLIDWLSIILRLKWLSPMQATKRRGTSGCARFFQPSCM